MPAILLKVYIMPFAESGVVEAPVGSCVRE
jgi:hypothetical protein